MLKHKWVGTVSSILLKSYPDKVQTAVTAGQSVVIRGSAGLEGWTWGHPSRHLHACLHRVLGQAACWCEDRTACLQRAVVRQCAGILHSPQTTAFLRGRRSECCRSDIWLESLSTISILQRLAVGSACAMQFVAVSISRHGGRHHYFERCQGKAREQLFLWCSHQGSWYVCTILCWLHGFIIERGIRDALAGIFLLLRSTAALLSLQSQVSRYFLSAAIRLFRMSAPGKKSIICWFCQTKKR